ncbi:UDP-N-acetylmuramate--L-alanine ligase [Rickettsiales bacterium LUAb2]
MYFDFMEKNPALPNKVIHFVGIGGIGMSSIANLLFSLGFKVQGSDIAVNSNVERLQALGIKITIGHNVENIKNTDIIVISSAIQPDNIEYMAAQQQNLPIYKRGRVLGEIMGFYFGIAVTGAHGKTTTTSLIGEILSSAKLEPTVVVGGVVNAWKSNFKVGKSKFFVAEADESDGSFLNLPSIISVVTNIESEHLDYYKTHEYLLDNFVQFVNKVPFFGKAILCIDDKGIQDIFPRIENTNIITYGFSKNANYVASNVEFSNEGTTFDITVTHKNHTISGITSKLYGMHNILNAVSAIAVADTLGLDEEDIKRGLANFNGVNRRFTNVGQYNNIQIIDDYAHHPSEIKAVVQSAKNINNINKIIGVVQPHRYTRLRDFFNEFIDALLYIDEVILLPVYTAGEKPIDNINSFELAKILAVKHNKKVVVLESKDQLAEIIKQKAKAHDMVICMGAGDITQLAHKLPSQLAELDKK